MEGDDSRGRCTPPLAISVLLTKTKLMRGICHVLKVHGVVARLLLAIGWTKLRAKW